MFIDILIVSYMHGILKRWPFGIQTIYYEINTWQHLTVNLDTRRFILRVYSYSAPSLFSILKKYFLSFLFIKVFKKMRMPQIRDPSLPKLEDLPDSYKAKVRIVSSSHIIKNISITRLCNIMVAGGSLSFQIVRIYDVKRCISS